jgi:hypothetical protein
VRPRHQIAQEAEALRLQKNCLQHDAGHVAAWPVEALDQASADRIASYREHDRDARCSVLGRERRAAHRGEHDHAAAHQIGGHRRQQLVLTARPAELDRNVLALDKAAFGQAAAEGNNEMRGILRRTRAEEPNYWYRRLLRAHREGPRCRTAEQRDHIASSQGWHGLSPPPRAAGLTLA